ncbi:hypothetical protein QBE52_01220 [Clostridiaceae bacterium 35-E11]
MEPELFKNIFYTSLVQGFREAFQMMWGIDEFKSAVIGIPVSIITFKVVGSIFRWGRNNGIWFGTIGGKVLYYLINTFIVWIIMKFV